MTYTKNNHNFLSNQIMLSEQLSGVTIYILFRFGIIKSHIISTKLYLTKSRVGHIDMSDFIFVFYVGQFDICQNDLLK